MTADTTVTTQRAWARVAGLMYWLVLLFDITGMQFNSTLGKSLALTGSLFTVPLALGLYFAVRPVQPALAATALGLRLLEATLGFLVIVTGFAFTRQSVFSTALQPLTGWMRATDFSAFVFTIGSTIFFYLFLRGHLIPTLLAGWGLFASLLAFVACLIHLLHPPFQEMTMGFWIPALLAETSTGLWLLLRSVNVNEEGLGWRHPLPPPSPTP